MVMAAVIISWGLQSLLAATAVKDFLAAHNIKGRVRYYGCPAEEGGAAKGFMVRWHPSAFSGVYEPVSLANTRHRFRLRRPRRARRRRAASGT
jgi:aminobenzoyl-glutamate utilization protein B